MNYKKCILTCYIFSFFISGILHAEDTAYQGKFPTLESWIQAFKSLPQNRDGAQPALHSGFAPCGDKKQQWQEVKNVLQQFLTMKKNGPLADESNWNINDKQKTKPDENFFDTSKNPTFTPFAQKIITKPGSEFLVQGDLHGDIFSLLEKLKKMQAEGVIDSNFKITKPDTNLLFLGDYVDRGKYGSEVLYTLMRLALANPDNVIAVRGNHEDSNLQARYGFQKEVKEKFNDLNNKNHIELSRIYDFLPTVCYLGCKDAQNTTNYIQACHGGIEEEYDPKAFLDNPDTKYQLLENASGNHCQNAGTCGHMWNDFSFKAHKNSGWSQINYDPDRGYKYGEQATEDILQEQSTNTSQIKGIIRGHQHNKETMPEILEHGGVHNAWRPVEKEPIRSLKDGIVRTFNVAPDNVYGEEYKFNDATHAKLTTAQDYKDWKMEVINTPVVKPSMLSSNNIKIAIMLMVVASSLGIYYKDNIKKTYYWLKTYLANKVNNVRNTLKGSPSEKKLLAT